MPNALVMGKRNKKLDMTIVKDLIIVSDCGEKVTVSLSTSKEKVWGQEIAKVKLSLGLI